MGLYIISYGIELLTVKRAFASKDDALLQAIYATETCEAYASQDFPDAVPTREAVRQIIYGEPYHARSAHSYGYALLILCSYFGVDLNGQTEMKLGYETDLIDDYLVTEFGVVGLTCAEDLLAETPDFGLPPVADFPASGLLSPAEIDSMHQQLAPINISAEQVEALLYADEERGIAYGGIKSLKDRIDYCYHHRLVLISFCH